MPGGNIKGITISFEGDTSKLDRSLRDVSNSAKKIDRELNQINRALKFNPGSVDLWRQKQTLLNQKITETQRKLDMLRQKQATMDASGVDKNSAEYRKLQREIIETESKLKSFKRELMSIGNVKLRALGEQFKQIGDKMTAVGKSMTQNVTLPLAMIGGVAVKKFAEVDKTMTLTNATMHNSAEEAALLDKAMKEAAANSTYGMNDAATATLNFARAGLSAEQAASALGPAMALAAGEGGELDTVSAGLVATINGFHGSFDDAAHYADVFANACNNSALDVNSLSEAMSVAAPIFSAAGYQVEDAALYMGVMANNGIDANKAANSLKTGIARLVSPTAESASMMDKLGISITNSDGTMKSSVQVQKELHDAFSQLSESEQIAAASAIFGKNQMAPWLALINTAPEDVAKLSGELEKNGTAMQMQSSMMSGFAGSLEKLKSGIDVMMTSLGQALAPVIEKVASGIQKLVDWFNNLSPQMQTVIATIGVIVAAIGPVLVILGTIASGIGSIITLVGIVGPVIAGLAGPIGIVVAVIAGAIAAGVALYKNWDKIKAKANEIKGKLANVWNHIKGRIVKSVEAIKKAVTKAWDAIKDVTETVWNAVAKVIETVLNIIFGAITAYLKLYLTVITVTFKAIQKVIEVVWNAIKAATTATWNAIKSVVTTVANALKNVITTVFNAIKSVVTTVWNGIQTLTTTVWNSIKTFVTNAVNTIKSAVTTGFNAIKSAVTTAWNGVQSVTSSVWNSVKSTVNNAVNGIKSTVTSAVNGVKSVVTSAWNGIQSVTSSVWNTIKSAVSNAVSTIRSVVSGAFGGLSGAVSSAFNAVKNAIVTPLNSAKQLVSDAISKIKSVINGATFKLPHIKLPHFTITGNFSLNPPSVPHFSVNWYKTGGIFDAPSIIGVGEAGPEAVVPIDKLWKKLDAIAAGTQEQNVTINVYATPGMSVERLAEEIEARFVLLQKQRSKAWGT